MESSDLTWSAQENGALGLVRGSSRESSAFRTPLSEPRSSWLLKFLDIRPSGARNIIVATSRRAQSDRCVPTCRDNENKVRLVSANVIICVQSSYVNYAMVNTEKIGVDDTLEGPKRPIWLRKFFFCK